jgi:hypothetical protein
MAKHSVYDWYVDLPKWARGTIIVGGTVVVVGVAYTIYMSIKKAKQDAIDNAAAISAANDLANLANQGVRPTMTDTVFETYSQSIVVALQGCTEDEQTVFNIMSSMQNTADILELVKVFGVRKVEPCAVSSPISWALDLTGLKSFGGGLPSVMTWGLNSSQIQQINDDFSTRGINFKF